MFENSIPAFPTKWDAQLAERNFLTRFRESHRPRPVFC
ncbi:DUF6783 domain-containing protein, partial [Eggerthella lenta]